MADNQKNGLQLRQLQLADCVERLEQSNQISARYGLVLTGAQMEALAQRRFEVLEEMGRVEFGVAVLPKLAEAFCDSPYLCQSNYEETLGELQELFYYFKNESGDRIADDELIAGMKRIFDGKAQGATEYLSGVPMEAFTDPDWGEEPIWSED